MAAVGWGFDSQVNGAILSVASFRRDFGTFKVVFVLTLLEIYVENGEAILPAARQAAFNVISSVGQFFGGFLCSYASDLVGRRPSLLAGLLIATGGIFGEIFSSTNAAFLVSRLVLGFGLGFLLTLAPLATSEIAPVVLRGLSTAGVNLGIVVGQLLSNAVVKAFGERTDVWAYRGPFATQFFFVVFLGAGLPFVPETPWYLARKNKCDAAKAAIIKLYGPKVDASSKLASILDTIAEENSTLDKETTWVDCVRGTNLVRSMISMGVFLCQHFVGIVFVLGYSTYFFQLAGLADSRSFDLGVGVTACGVVGNICSWFVVNRLGRRVVFNCGMAVIIALLMLIGIMDVVPTNGAQWVQASCTVIYAFVYFATVGAMAFVILGEAVMGVLMHFIIPYLMNPDEAHLKGKVGFIFGGLGLIALVWSWLYVPELKGRRYDEIDVMFQRKVPIRKMGSFQI